MTRTIEFTDLGQTVQTVEFKNQEKIDFSQTDIQVQLYYDGKDTPHNDVPAKGLVYNRYNPAKDEFHFIIPHRSKSVRVVMNSPSNFDLEKIKVEIR
jgi:hypothetical protein